MIHLLFLSLLISAFGYVEVNRDYPEYIPGEYLITYHLNTTSEEAQNHVLAYSAKEVEFLHIWNTGFHKGFAAKLSDEILAELQNDPIIMAIEVNMVVNMFDTEQSCDGSTASALSWGLSRISYSGDIYTGGLPNSFVYPYSGGSGTTVYVADTGVLTTHVDFSSGRATWGVNYAGGGNVDGNGHGTHCAGTVGGNTYGVAKATAIVAVKVLNAQGSGTMANIVSGINWVTNNAYPYKSVISMSLGGTGTVPAALRTAVDNAVGSNIAVVVAAGNSNANACSFYPAAIASCITVGATALGGSGSSRWDSRSTFSNYGTCVHIFAPGTNIRSAWIGSNTASNTISGTSMACPHVAGLSATVLATSSNMTPSQLKSRLVSTSQQGLIDSPGTGSPNRLAYNGCN
jgi:subtilisin family serine protease